MRYVGVTAAVAAVICVSCGRQDPSAPDSSGAIVRFFDAGAREVAQRPEPELDRARPAITLENGGRHTVSNCRDYLLWTSRGSQPVTDHDGAATSNYVMCAVAALAPLARTQSRSMFVPDTIGDAIYRSLDLRTFVSSLRAEADAGKHYLADFDFSPVSVTHDAIEAETSDWRFSFQALAAGDFDGDGIEDLLVAFTEAAKKGTALLAMTLLLRRNQPDADISATVPGPTGVG